MFCHFVDLWIRGHCLIDIPFSYKLVARFVLHFMGHLSDIARGIIDELIRVKCVQGVCNLALRCTLCYGISRVNALNVPNRSQNAC
jgi:hypothetical protein